MVRAAREGEAATRGFKEPMQAEGSPLSVTAGLRD